MPNQLTNDALEISTNKTGSKGTRRKDIKVSTNDAEVVAWWISALDGAAPAHDVIDQLLVTGVVVAVDVRVATRAAYRGTVVRRRFPSTE